MALNKKQKKQIDSHKQKIQKLQQLLAAAKQQPDDPEDIPRLTAEIEAHRTEIKAIEAGKFA